MENANTLVDASFLVALFRENDQHADWATATAQKYPPPWLVPESVLSETDHLLAPHDCHVLRQACRNGAIRLASLTREQLLPILDLLDKYADVPMSVADATLVLLTETLDNPTLLTTDSDFKIYRRFKRKSIPAVFPKNS